MNSKIPFHQLASMMSANCNITQTEAEDFIKSFFEGLAKNLSEGETVKVKGIGVFARENDPENPVSFTPDSEIADAINAPFAMFEPEEMSSTLSDDAFESDIFMTDVNAPESLATTTPEVSIQESISEKEPVEEMPVEIKSVEEEPLEEEPVVEVPVIETPLAEEPTAVTPVVEETATETPVDEMLTTETPVYEAPVSEVSATETPVSVENPVVIAAPVVSAAGNKDSHVREMAENAGQNLPEDEPEEYFNEPEKNQKSGPGFGWGFIIGLLTGLALGACGVYFAIDYIFPTMPEEYNQLLQNAELTDDSASALAMLEEVLPDTAVDATAVIATTAVAGSDSIESKDNTEKSMSESNQTAGPTKATETKAEKAVVKDKVSRGYLLHDMAKKHYGNKCFWVYIYEENRSKITNPNRVSPGLELIIPDATKYGIDPSSQASIKKANEKAGQILAKYPK